MKQIFRKSTAILLVLVQLFMLCPVIMPAAMAVETEPETPALNKTIVGTVQFQSFNFLGDNDSGEDGTDYTSTFYYTDDYFAHSAVNENVNSQSVPWTELDDVSLAACSMDFAVASYTSAEGDVIRASTQSWNNTDYSNKDKNVRAFLSACGFSNIEPHSLTQRPTNDSIGYTLASKTITVWNADKQKNETYTLIAVGCRGAGYGAEWASNVTIGNPSTSALPANGRHYGFDYSAQLVCEGIRSYLSSHSISGNVKYWVTGFSRAAAVANLVAGYLTDGVSTYKAQQKDVYGYTFECPQAASTSENALNYKNIHNIVNPMDAVPKVSPTDFNHQRLGVDYQMPYHGTAGLTSDQHRELYNRMFNALKTIATGSGQTGEADPLVDNPDTSAAYDGYVSPNVYPYNSKMTIYKMSGWQLIQDAIGGTDKLMSNFGTVVASGNLDNSSKLLGQSDGGWYIDQFIDHLIDIFLTSNAWIGGTGNNRTAMQNRTTFISNYQNNFRNLLGYFLDFSGPAFLGLIPKLIDAIRPQLTDITNLGLGYAFYKFYNEPNGSFSSFNVFAGQFRGKPYKTALIYYAKNTAKEVANDMVSGFTDPQGISKTTMNSAMDSVVELLINLYAYELDAFESQYLGTSLKYLWEILCTHEQETVMSWIKSLDDNFISDYRRITLPKSADIDLYVFREGLEDELSKTDYLAADARGALVAKVQNGSFVSLTGADGRTYDRLDDRITLSQSGESVIITYPGTMDLRFDVQGTFADLPVQLADLAPTSTVNTKSTATRNSRGNITATQIVTDSMLTQDNTQTANGINTFSNSNAIDLAAGETLSVIAWHGSNQVMDGYNAEYALYKTTTKTVVADFGSIVMKNATLMNGSSSSNGTFAASGNDVVYQLSADVSSGALNSAFSAADTAKLDLQSTSLLGLGENLTVVPASSIYYDDDLNGQTFTSDGHGYSGDINDAAVSRSASAVSGTFYYTFYGTGIDVYCTTDSESSYVSAAVFKGTGPDACVKANRVGSAQTVSNKSSEGTRYNTPTISFMDLGEQDTYTLKIVANEGAKFKLDGVRVYDPVQKGTAAADAQAAAGEGNVLYLNLHDLLLNADQGFSVNPVAGMSDDFDKSAISGVLFIDNADALVTESHYDADGEWHEEMTQLYATQFEAYRTNSPNNEIYLAAATKDEDGNDVTQAITFQVNTQKAPVGSTVYVGMSAPETGRGTVSVPGSGSKPVTSVMDMYYGVTVPANGLITITNVGDSLISLTNLKITNVPESKGILGLSAAEKDVVMRAFFAPVTTETIELAAVQETGTITTQPEETPDPTPATIGDLISQMISTFVQSLFSSISRMFGH